MNPRKAFKVFGENIEVLVTSEETQGTFSMIVQTSPPGGGPPPHMHRDEDEIFRVLQGEFELFDGTQWTKLQAGEYAYTLRGSVHTFRNCGTTEGKIQAIVIPGKLDRYLEAISPFNMPQDVERVLEISQDFGITFVTPDQQT
ncbi:cupin domain-containing protein [Edaphobacter albus]|uniref:cupin domain-containing protein n=1 Tax=Edaphobacter sp. 4G125 TaxID=2763071 RepID=UPI0016447676|nr:cupin domain-containing protein [Edaphobacter sp. 4G125]QNI36119.1 cupin domain-containing protein [Edaphobacter sp. 4G125]